MAKKKSTVNLHAQRLSVLKKYGDAPVKNKKRFSKSEKAKILRHFRKIADIEASPENYQKTIIRSETKKQLLKRAGVTIIGAKAYLPLEGYDSAKVTTNPHFNIPVIEYQTEDKIVHKPLITKTNLLEILQHYDKKNDPLPRGVFVTVKIGDNAPFSRIFTNYGELYNYVRFGFTPSTDDADEVINEMELVYFTREFN